MLKKIICTIATLSLAFSMCSCSSETKTTIVDNSSQSELNVQNGQKSESYVIDLETCAKNAQEAFKNDKYPAMDVSITPPNDNSSCFNIIIVAEEKPEDETLYITWIKDALKVLNEEAIKQEPRYAAASEGYYGGLFDQYSVLLTATCNDDIIKVWTINQTIEAGSHDPIVTNHDEIDLSKIQ